MVRKLPSTDFRAKRMVLEPDDYGLTDGLPDPAPTDLIDQSVWHGIMDLPDDVVIRTTSHQGSRINLLYELWAGWLEVMPTEGIVTQAMLDCSDDFASATMLLLHGFYRQAIGTLRSALETMLFSCLCQITGNLQRWSSWKKGKEELSFVNNRHDMRKTDIIRSLEVRAQAATGRTLFADKNGADPGGWATSLHARLSNFIHARGNQTNADIWGSNGPIYSAQGMKLGYHNQLETYVLLLLMAKIATPSIDMPIHAEVLFSYDSRQRYLQKLDRKICRFIKLEIFH
jgi:hypothetical protein